MGCSAEEPLTACTPQLRPACPRATSITQGRRLPPHPVSPNRPFPTSAPGRASCTQSSGSMNVPGTGAAARCRAPRVRTPAQPRSPPRWGCFGHSLPARSRHPPGPVSSPLLPSPHQLPQLCRTPDGRTGLQPCRAPAPASAPPPSPPASSALPAAPARSPEDRSSRATAEGHGAAGTIANAPSERHKRTLDFSQPGGELCSCPGTAGRAGVQRAGVQRAGVQRLSPLMSSCHPRSESMWGRSPLLPWEKGLAGDSHC